MTLTNIPAAVRRRLPAIHIGNDQQSFLVDRIGLLYIGRRFPLAETPESAHVQVAAAWLAEAQPIATAALGSYALKHVVERWGGRYISNGAFLLAAYRAGFTLRWSYRFGPNCRVGISKRWLRERPELQARYQYQHPSCAGRSAPKFVPRPIPGMGLVPCTAASCLR